MAKFLENFNMDFEEDNERIIENLMVDSVKNYDNLFVGYYGNMYFQKDYGNLEMQVRVRMEKENQKLAILDYDTHCVGSSIWDVCISEMNVDYKDEDHLRKRVVVKSKETGKGMCVVDLMNADILPSFLDGDELKMQVIGFPITIDYFNSEDEYEKTLKKDRFGKTFGLAENTLFPLGVFTNGNPDNNEEIIDEVWNHTMVHAKVKAFRKTCTKIGDTEMPLVEAVIDTPFGELELVHTYDQVKDEQKNNLKTGAVVSAIIEISGDPAIDAYSKGIIKDEEHNLRLLRYVMMSESPERLRSVMDSNVVLIPDGYEQYNGIDQVLSVIQGIQVSSSTNEVKPGAYMGTIAEIKPGNEELPYGEGKRCFVLAYDNAAIEAMVFIENNRDGLINKINIVREERYGIRLDKLLGEVSMDDYVIPDNCYDAMMARAAFHCIIDIEEGEKLLEQKIGPEYIDDAEMMYQGVKEAGFDRDVYAFMFGYMFAKQYEKKFSTSGHLGFSIDDVLDKQIRTDLPEEHKERIDIAIDLGSQFYMDFERYHEKPDEQYDAEIKRALVVVQELGRQYAEKEW